MSDVTQQQCYNCNSLNVITNIFCDKCQVIQPPATNNFFTYFGLQPNFVIDEAGLEAIYLTLQQKLHPDLFLQKSAIEQNFAFKHSLILNQAYQTLKDDLARSEYLLKLNDIIVNSDAQDNVKVDSDLLEEIFELQQQINDAENKDQLNILYKDINDQRNNLGKDLAQLFLQKEYVKMAHLTIKLCFIEKSLKNIKQQLLCS